MIYYVDSKREAPQAKKKKNKYHEDYFATPDLVRQSLFLVRCFSFDSAVFGKQTHIFSSWGAAAALPELPSSAPEPRGGEIKRNCKSLPLIAACLIDQHGLLHRSVSGAGGQNIPDCAASTREDKIHWGKNQYAPASTAGIPAELH